MMNALTCAIERQWSQRKDTVKYDYVVIDSKEDELKA